MSLINENNNGSFDDARPWGYWQPSRFARLSLWLIDLLPGNGFGRRCAFLLRRPVKKGRQLNYDREVWGLKLRLMARGNLTEQRWLTMPAFHDVEERSCLAETLKKGDVFLDIGANAGFYTMWVLSRFKESVRVIAVEPNRELRKRLSFNLGLNGLTGAVKLLEYAVTPENGELVLEETTGNLGQGRVVAAEQGTGSTVQGRTLRDILDGLGITKVDALKIDIEGGETEALGPYFRDTPESSWPKMIITEVVGEDSADIVNLLQEKGYSCTQQCRMNGVFTR